ncbi:pyridoxal phosphate-dependent aminotransferase [uncultured Sulfitobacter sp.]|uniref:pyridoxal phosphate-dependent aminotransferase n=1 Tax=uncultured Sulfitobacter sp. TaxID=191468 RepID=UPI0025943746|nr:pyridoxal phosphate-dependent aminotransferase [uncultured Sulfitobacter sp.]
MTLIETKFAALGTGNAPGQEIRQSGNGFSGLIKGNPIQGTPVDFSHGDIDAHPPTPGAAETWSAGYALGGAQAYTEYRGLADIRTQVAADLTEFTGAPIDAENEMIVTPGTQGALFLALGATVTNGTKVAVIEPDYFANRKLVTFFGGTVVPVPLIYGDENRDAGPDLNALEAAFHNGVEVLVFSTPNNPTGVVTAAETINRIAALAAQYGVAVIVDQLYARMLYSGETYTHLLACANVPENLITIMGPSKTESLSGFRLGVAFGSAALIDRMEKLQAIVSLRAAGYNQAALQTWFHEPEGWLERRIRAHQAIRDDLLAVFNAAGMATVTPQAGSYLYPQLPKLDIGLQDFVRLLRQQAAVTVTPGTEFSQRDHDRIRLNFSQDHRAAVEAAGRITALAARYAA